MHNIRPIPYQPQQVLRIPADESPDDSIKEQCHPLDISTKGSRLNKRMAVIECLRQGVNPYQPTVETGNLAGYPVFGKSPKSVVIVDYAQRSLR